MMLAAPLLLVLFFYFEINYFHCVFMQSLPLYTSYLFSMRLNEDIVDIEKLDGICVLTFVVDEFSGLFLHPSIFSIKHGRSA